MNHSGPLPTHGSIDLSAGPADRQITQGPPTLSDDAATQPLASPPVSRLVEELSLTGLRPGDRIMLCTANSVYTLTIIHPALPLGYLSGGRLGSVPVRACPVPIPTRDGATGQANKTLRRGGRVLFLLQSSAGVLYFSPTPITGLVYRKAGQE